MSRLRTFRDGFLFEVCRIAIELVQVAVVTSTHVWQWRPRVLTADDAIAGPPNTATLKTNNRKFFTVDPCDLLWVLVVYQTMFKCFV